MCWCVTEVVTGCWVCSSALSEQILSAGSESPPWTDPPASYRHTHTEQLASALVRSNTLAAARNQKSIRPREQRGENGSKRWLFRILLLLWQRGEKSTLAAEAEMQGGYWAKHWSRFCKTNPLCRKDGQIREHTKTHAAEDGAGGEGHTVGRRWKSCPQNTETMELRNKKNKKNALLWVSGDGRRRKKIQIQLPSNLQQRPGILESSGKSARK